MRKLILVVHISLDGFVAGTNGELDGFEPGEENLQFVCQLTEEADAALFGRNSYQLLDTHWPTAGKLPDASKGVIAYSNWYNKAQKIVLSKTLVKGNSANTIIIKEDIFNNLTGIKKQPGKDIMIFGSPAASQTLMQFGLIDGYWIFINPVIFGKGIPLFREMKDRAKLQLVSTKEFSNGELALHFITK